MAAISKGNEIKISTILPLFVETRNQLVKKEIADAEPLELHLAPLQGDEKDEARGVVERGDGRGAGASQRQNSFDCQPNHISLKQYKLQYKQPKKQFNVQNTPFIGQKEPKNSGMVPPPQNNCILEYIHSFLAVQDSSIGDIVSD